MATITFKNLGQLEDYLNTACNKAIDKTAKAAQEKLKECIDTQYYKDPSFYPNVYKRTQEFLNHAAYQLLTSKSAEVYIDIEGMHYKNSFSAWQVVSWASESKHGADYYQTDTTDFWTVFIEWCNDNLLNLLITNLKQAGLKIS